MSTFTTSGLYIELIGTGEQNGLWGGTTNNNFQYVFEQAIVGRVSVAFSDADVTLTAVAASTNQTFRNLYLNCTGTNTASRNLIVPTINKTYVVENNTTGGFAIVVKTSAGTGITIPNGYKASVYADGTNVVQAFNYFPSLNAGSYIGTWAGSAITTAYGGTGLSSYTAGDLPYYASGTALSKLGIGTNGQILTSSGTAPQWSNIGGVTVTSFQTSLSGLTPATATNGAVTLAGTLGVSSGGTGLTSLTAGYIPYGNGTGAFSSTANLTYNNATGNGLLNIGQATTTSVATALVLNGTNNAGNGSYVAGLRNSANAWLVGDIQSALGSGTGFLTYVYGANPTQWYNNSINTMTLSSGGALSLPYADALINGLTFGKGNSAVATNTAVGYQALNANTTGSSNTAYGYQSLISNTTGTANTTFGFQSGRLVVTSNGVTAIGFQSQVSSTAGNNTSLGYASLIYNTTGTFNTAIGGGEYGIQGASLQNNTTGSSNTAVGHSALSCNTTASNNTVVGYQAGLSNTTGGIDAFGAGALYANTTGIASVAVGQLTLRFNSTGNYNTAVGYTALYSNTTANYNTALGYGAGYSTSTGTSNTALGFQALSLNTTGYANIAIGRNSLNSNTTGYQNIAIGSQDDLTLYGALRSNTTGIVNLAIGNASLQGNTTGSYNISLGQQSLFTNTTGSGNTVVGYQAGYSNTTGDYNACFGRRSGNAITTGAQNTFIGNVAGQAITTGNYNTIIGAYDGNTGGLDIRTASNYIVLSDGQGNPRQIIDNNGNLGLGITPGNLYTPGRVIQVGAAGGATLYGSTSTMALSINTNIDVSGNYTYASTNYALNYKQVSGVHVWYTAPSGTAGNAITFTQTMTLDNSGNLGLGITPSTWGGGYKSIDNQIYNSSYSTNGGFAGMAFNAYYNGTNWIYKNTTYANRFESTLDSFKWFNAPSGTAGNAITFTQAMTLDGSGNLGIGTTSPSSKLTVVTSGTSLAAFQGAQYSQIRHSDGTRVLYTQVYANEARLFTETSTPLLFGTNDIEKMRLDTAGNLGLGITPSAWDASYKALDISGNVGICGYSNNLYALANAYVNGGIYKYKASTYASLALQTAGQHQWYTAPSGIAGNTITFTQAMTLDNNGNLGIGTTSPSSYGKLSVWGGNIFVQSTTPGTGSKITLADNLFSVSLESSPVAGASNMLFRTGSTLQMTLDQNGNLGLGITPSAWGSVIKALDINFAGAIGASSNAIEMYLNSYYNGTNFIYKNTGVATKYEQSLGAHKWYNAPSGTGGATISFTQAMTLDSSGNLGLGVTPVAGYGTSLQLQQTGGGATVCFLQQSIATNNQLLFIGNNALPPSGAYTGNYNYTWTGANASAYTQQAGLHSWISAATGTAGNTISFTNGMYFDASGNFGIGMTPATAGFGTSLQLRQQNSNGATVALLHQSIATNNQLLSLSNNAIPPSGAYTGTYNYTYTGASATLYNQVAGAHTWYNAPTGTAGNAITFTQAMTLDTSGFLLVGRTTLTSGYASSINSTAFGAGNFGHNIQNFSATLTTFESFTNNSGVIAGSITQATSTSVAFNTTSDQRLKTNIVNSPPGNIDQIKVRSFDWITDDIHQEYGMVAQELVEVAPYAVHQPSNPDEMMAVDYSKLVPMMIKEIQDLKQRITTLEKK